ncbi:MAG: TAXI family TRAP transporter solute-binding subunit, partial [Clostridium sp.]
MKKRLMALAMVSAMVLSACTKSTTAPTTAAPAAGETTAAAAETAAPAASGTAQTLKLATGGTTGTYYAYGGVIANTLNSKLPNVQLNVQSTGASKANIFLIDDGEADAALVQNDVMDYAS